MQDGEVVRRVQNRTARKQVNQRYVEDEVDDDDAMASRSGLL